MCTSKRTWQNVWHIYAIDISQLTAWCRVCVCELTCWCYGADWSETVEPRTTVNTSYTRDTATAITVSTVTYTLTGRQTTRQISTNTCRYIQTQYRLYQAIMHKLWCHLAWFSNACIVFVPSSKIVINSIQIDPQLVMLLFVNLTNCCRMASQTLYARMANETS